MCGQTRSRTRSSSRADRGGVQSGLSDPPCLFMHPVLSVAGLISNTSFGYHATLFNDHCCGYPVFGQINHKSGFPMKTGSTTPSKPEDDWYIRYRDENAASAKAKGIADGVFSILTYNNVHHTGWPQSSSIYAIDPFEVFSEERPEVVESWILRSQKMLSSNYPVGEAIVGQYPTRDMLEDQFIALNPGFSKESYGYAIYLGCVAAR